MCCSPLSSECDPKAVLLSFPHLVPAFLTHQVCVGLRGAREQPELGEAGLGQETEEEAADKN